MIAGAYIDGDYIAGRLPLGIAATTNQIIGIILHATINIDEISGTPSHATILTATSGNATLENKVT